MNQLPHITKTTAEATSKIDWMGKGPKRKIKATTENTVIFTEEKMLECCLFAFAVVISDTQ